MDDNIDDQALVTAAQQGDRAALEQLIRRHHERVVAICRRITGNESDALDAAQDAMIAMVRGLARFDGRSSVSTWMYRIATNASLDELRRRRRRPLTVVRDPDRPDHEYADPHAGRPIDLVADRAEVEAALLAVPEEFRIPVVLRDVADLEYSDIADALGLPVGTVKSRIARGRGMLGRALTQGSGTAGIGNQSDLGGRPTPEPEP
jgi:RNA polymerase sigma-70 factor (ECF subfamily)